MEQVDMIYEQLEPIQGLQETVQFLRNRHHAAVLQLNEWKHEAKEKTRMCLKTQEELNYVQALLNNSNNQAAKLMKVLKHVSPFEEDAIQTIMDTNPILQDLHFQPQVLQSVNPFADARYMVPSQPDSSPFMRTSNFRTEGIPDYSLSSFAGKYNFTSQGSYDSAIVYTNQQPSLGNNSFSMVSNAQGYEAENNFAALEVLGSVHVPSMNSQTSASVPEVLPPVIVHSEPITMIPTPRFVSSDINVCGTGLATANQQPALYDINMLGNQFESMPFNEMSSEIPQMALDKPSPFATAGNNVRLLNSWATLQNHPMGWISNISLKS